MLTAAGLSRGSISLALLKESMGLLKPFLRGCLKIQINSTIG